MTSTTTSTSTSTMKFVLVLVLELVLGRSALAQNDDTLAYRVRQGDTLEVVAAEFYGDKTLTMFIITENKLLEPKQYKPRALRPGERLRVPVTREIATAKGDGFEQLAQTYLGDSKRAQYLADYNNIAIDQNLPAGTALLVPLHVTHTAQNGGESLTAIAQLYYGDGKQAELLKKYNGLDKPGIEKGESIIVPLMRAKSTKTIPLDADAKDRHDKQKKAIADAQLALPKARGAWIVGDFAGVKAALDKVVDETDYLDAATAVDIDVLLGKAHVAFDEQDAAVAAFTHAIDRRPRYTLAPYSDSPKVLAAWRKAGGHVEGE